MHEMINTIQNIPYAPAVLIGLILFLCVYLWARKNTKVTLPKYTAPSLVNGKNATPFAPPPAPSLAKNTSLPDYPAQPLHIQDLSESDVKTLQKMASPQFGKGDAKAQYELGKRYYIGSGGVQKNEIKAASYYEQAAKQGHAKAQYEIGFCYSHAVGVKKDEKLAIFYYEQAAKQGNADAQYWLGRLYEHAYDIEENEKHAAFYYEQAAKQGHSEAQYDIGDMCYFAYGVEGNTEKAAFYYEQAAKQDDREAQYKMGLLYHDGTGVKQDSETAVRWLVQAAKQGDRDAMRLLADGLGKPKTHDERVADLERCTDERLGLTSENPVHAYGYALFYSYFYEDTFLELAEFPELAEDPDIAEYFAPIEPDEATKALRASLSPQHIIEAEAFSKKLNEQLKRYTGTKSRTI